MGWVWNVSSDDSWGKQVVERYMHVYHKLGEIDDIEEETI